MLKLLVDPRTEGAYFADALTVAQGEFRARYPDVSIAVDARRSLVFLDADLESSEASHLARLSFVQGVFRAADDALHLLEGDPSYGLPAGLVWGAKYRGKTHELVTQLGLNLALATCTAEGPHTLLDPMAGRGTTLFWAARHGLSAWGVERDPKALADVQRHVKRQTQLLRIKHRQSHGWVGPKRKDGIGRFVATQFGEVEVQLVTGDSRQLRDLIGPKSFSLIVSDLPYGIQHTGPAGTRNPIRLLEACASGWTRALAPGGAMVLIFNRLQPRRPALERVFQDQGLVVHNHELAHRMSESIWRDLLVLHKPELGDARSSSLEDVDHGESNAVGGDA
ncbi:MAG: hypothetical protein AAGA48_19685 [Myxococcota bacterium]